MKHTPKPWKTGHNTGGIHQAAIIFDADGNGVASCKDHSTTRKTVKQCEEITASIVEACNTHDRLKDERDAALESAKVLVKANDALCAMLLEAADCIKDISWDSSDYELAIRALALAKGKEGAKQ